MQQSVTWDWYWVRSEKGFKNERDFFQGRAEIKMRDATEETSVKKEEKAENPRSILFPLFYPFLLFLHNSSTSTIIQLNPRQLMER